MRYLSEESGLFLDPNEHSIKFTEFGEIVVGPGILTFPEGEIQTREILIGNANHPLKFQGEWIPNSTYSRGDVVTAEAIDGSISYLTYQKDKFSTDLSEDIDLGDSIEIAIQSKSTTQQLYFVQDSAKISFRLKKPWIEDNGEFVIDSGTFSATASGSRFFRVVGKIDQLILEYEGAPLNSSIRVYNSSNVLLDSFLVERSFGFAVLDTSLSLESEMLRVDGDFLTNSVSIGEGGYQLILGQTELTVVSANLFLTEEFIETENRIANLGKIHLDGNGTPTQYVSEKLIASEPNTSVADWLTRNQDEFLVEKLQQLKNYRISELSEESAPWKMQQVGIEAIGVFNLELFQKEAWFLNSHSKKSLDEWPFNNSQVGRHQQILDYSSIGSGLYTVNGRESTTIDVWESNSYLLKNEAQTLEVSGGGALIKDGILTINECSSTSFNNPDVVCHPWINTSDWSDHHEDWNGLYPSKGTDDSIHFMLDLLRLHGYDSNSTEFTSSYLDVPTNLRIQTFPPFRVGISRVGIDPIGSGRAYIRVPPNYQRGGKYWKQIEEVLRRFSGPKDIRLQPAFLTADQAAAGDSVFDP
jgi:hypothetical protein